MQLLFLCVLSLFAPAGFASGFPYDLTAGNPPRESLRFPEFQAGWGLKRAIFEKARSYFERNKNAIANPRYFAVVDFHLHSSRKRFFLFDLSNDRVERHNVAAGKGSDPDNDGFATEFSNERREYKSSLGFYRTLESYSGGNGYSLRLDGLEESNSNAYVRAIVVHGADYVDNAESVAGRSWGCPALDPGVVREVIDRLKGGAPLLIDR